MSQNDLFRLAIPEEFGGLGLNCEQFFPSWRSSAAAGMRMNLHHANGLNWRIMYDHGAPTSR
jgi:alkylation response protein AidB-like acyl-CoA dehydrogenase